MSDQAWQYREHALIVLPGVSWDEWMVLWSSVEQTNKSSQFWVGDALLAGQREFGERFSQAVDPKYINSQRGAMWVCSRIEPSRRRPNLSYSLHREVAALDPEAQDGWLDQAAAANWTVRELKEAMAARRPGSNGGPPLNGSTRNGDDASPEPLSGVVRDEAPVALPPYRPSLETILAQLPPECRGLIGFSEQVAGERLYSVLITTSDGTTLGRAKGSSLIGAVIDAVDDMERRAA